MERDAQLAELRHVEQQLGVKFWKVKVDSGKKARFLKSLAEATEPPPDNRMPRRFREEMQPRGPSLPFFYNLCVRPVSPATRSLCNGRSPTLPLTPPHPSTPHLTATATRGGASRG